MITRPMRGKAIVQADFDRLRYPLIGSWKLDGIRCLVHPLHGPVSRSFIPIKNHFIRESLSSRHALYHDGELMLMNRATGKPAPFGEIDSAVMSHDGQPDFEFWVFDYFRQPNDPYAVRIRDIVSQEFEGWKIVKMPQTVCANPEEARAFAASCLELGFEGAIFRDPAGAYKSGQSTVKQQGLIKYKEFFDDEGEVVGFEELYRNTNPLERDAFGLAKRSSKKEGMVAAGTLGKVVLNTKWGELRAGSGFDIPTRDHIWANRPSFLGKICTFTYQKYGMDELPRFPIAKRFRSKE